VVNNSQQLFDLFQRKQGSTFASSKNGQILHSSVFHKIQIRNPFIPSIFHFYNFCRRIVPLAAFTLELPKKSHFNTVSDVTIRCVSPGG